MRFLLRGATPHNLSFPLVFMPVAGMLRTLTYRALRCLKTRVKRYAQSYPPIYLATLPSSRRSAPLLLGQRFTLVGFALACTFLVSCASVLPAYKTSTKATTTNPSEKSLWRSSAVSASALAPDLRDSTRYEPGKARDYFIKGAVLQMQERPAEAILEFQQALRYDNAPAIRFAIAQNYAKLNKQDLAIEELSAVIASDSSFTPAYKLLGELYVQQFRVDDAISVYERLESFGSEPVQRFMLARLYELRDVDKAIVLYNDLLQSNDPNDAVILARLAELYTEQGDAAKTLECLERLRAASPDNQAVLFTLMDAYLEQKKYEEALELFISAEPVIADDEAVMLATRYANGLLGEFESSMTARICADKFLSRLELQNKAVYARSWQVQLMSGMLADNLQRSARSAAYFNRMLELDDTPAEAALQVCAYYFQNGRYNHMTQAAEKAAKRFPKNAQLYFLWGLALSQNSSSTMRAIEVLERSVNLDSSNVDALNQLAILYSSAGNTAASDAAYQSVLRIDPDNALANNNYAYALSERNQELDRAQAMIEIALKAEPKNPSYLDTMGWILYKRGDYKQALEYILQAIENGEVSATVYEHLGDVYQKLGNNAEAEKFWREALRKDSHRQSAKERLFHDKTNK